MKQRLNYFVLALLLVALSATISLAQGKDRSGSFSLGEDDKSYYLNGSPVERGSYRIKYDGDTGLMTIKHEGKVIATVKPRLVEEAEKSPYDAIATKQVENGFKLVSVRFEGDRRTFYIEQENLSEKSDEQEQ
jgi:hypothetical protein